jgi:hypothetical protein
MSRLATTALVAEADGWDNDDVDVSDHHQHPTTTCKNNFIVDKEEEDVVYDTPESSGRQHHHHQNQKQGDTARPIILGNGRSTPVTTNMSPTSKQKATTGGGVVGTTNSNSDHQDGWDDFGDDAEEEDFFDEPATSKDVNIGVPPPSRRLEVELSKCIISLSHKHQHMNNGSIATILAAEYNTVEKVVELNAYYIGRPACYSTRSKKKWHGWIARSCTKGTWPRHRRRTTTAAGRQCDTCRHVSCRRRVIVDAAAITARCRTMADLSPRVRGAARRNEHVDRRPTTVGTAAKKFVDRRRQFSRSVLAKFTNGTTSQCGRCLAGHEECLARH